MDFRIADTFTDSLAKLTGAAQWVEIRERVEEAAFVSANSFNESLSIEATEQALFLRPMGMGSWGCEKKSQLTFDGAAEYYREMHLSIEEYRAEKGRLVLVGRGVA